MKRIFLALRYGSLKTKMILIVIPLLILSGGGLLIYGIFGRALVPMGIGALLLIGGLVIMMSISFAPKEPDENDGKENTEDERKQGVPVARENAGYVPEWQNDIIVDEIVENKGTASVQKNKGDVIRPTQKNTDKGTAEAEASESKKAIHIAWSDEENTEETAVEQNENNEADATENDSYWDTDKPAERRSVIEAVVPTAKQLRERKKLLKVRGGNKKNTPIFIEECKRASAVKTPAYVQVKGKTVSIILVEKTLRTITMSLGRFTRVTYEKNMEEKHMEDYEELKKDKELYEIFEELMPNFYNGTNRVGMQGRFRNCYILGGSIYITPRSVRKLLKVFDLDFHVFDSLDIKGYYSDYFKKAYENRIFWTDGCISQAEYQNRIRTLLQSMVDDKDMLSYDFSEELNLMIRYKLITREYADYYLARKNEKSKSRA